MGTSVQDRVAAPVDPRFEQRRRVVAAEHRRRRLRGLAGVGAVAVLVALAWGSTRTAVFDVDVIGVTGADRTGAPAVATAAGIGLGDPLVDVDLARSATAVEALPWVASAVVTRDWRSGNVRIDVQERRPAAAVVTAEQVAVVDADGWVLVAAPVAAPPAEAEGLVGLEGVPVTAPGTRLDPAVVPLLEVAGALTPGVASRVAAVRRVDGGEVELVLQPRGSVRFGPPTDVAEKVSTLQTTFAEAQLDCLAAVDVRVADTAVLTREPTCG